MYLSDMCIFKCLLEWSRPENLTAQYPDSEAKPLQGYLAHKTQPPPLGPPYEPGHDPTVGSYGVAVSHKQGTPVNQMYFSDMWIFDYAANTWSPFEKGASQKLFLLIRKLPCS